MIIRHLPRTSALARAIEPDAELTTPEVQLLAANVDASLLLAWMQSADGAKNRNRPGPVLDALRASRGPVPKAMEYDPEYLAELDRIFSLPREAA